MADIVTGARSVLVMDVDLPRDRVWELITDVTAYHRWSPEVIGTEWADDRPDLRAGGRFFGQNRHPSGVEYRTHCVITEVSPPVTFAWVVLDPSHDVRRPGSIWRYELGDGMQPGRTRVRHTFEHGPGDTGVRPIAADDAALLAERLAALRQNMAVTLAGLLGQEGRVEIVPEP